MGYYTRRGGKLIMYSSEFFGRLFWVDDDLEFRSCPQYTDAQAILITLIMCQSGVTGKE